VKILRSIHSLNPAIGGPIESVRQSSAALIELGHEVEIITLDAPDAPWLREIGLTVHAVGNGRGGYGYTPELPRWLTAHPDYDAVIVHGIWQWSSFGVWRGLSGGKTPYFVFPHGMLDPWFNRTYPLKRLKKILYWRWGEYRVLRDAAAVLFTSEEERELARESFAPYRCNEVVVHYGTAAPSVDLNAARSAFLDRFPVLSGKRILLFLGRLHEKKGVDLLIKAFKATSRESGLHLVIAGPPGEGHYARQLQKLAADAGDTITFTGMLLGAMKWGAFAAADVFILPSHQENFGISVVEAMACGTPVLIANKVNIWREIVDDEAGFADDDDIAGTVRLLERWCELSEPKAAGMRQNARRCFASRFDIRRATESLLEVLERYRAPR